MSTELTALPSSFSAGSTVVYRRSLADYPASDSWVLKLYLAGVSVLTKTAVASGADHVVTLAASDTDDLTSGVYRWVERVSKGGEVYDVAWGTIEVTPDVATATAGELQPWAETALAAIEAKISGRITADQEEFEILGRAVKRIPFEELREIHSWLSGLVASASRGGAPRPSQLVQFSQLGYDR